jgi:hypothetical protein
MACIARSTFTVSAAFGGGKKKVTEAGNVKTSDTKKFANIGAAVKVRPSAFYVQHIPQHAPRARREDPCRRFTSAPPRLTV